MPDNEAYYALHMRALKTLVHALHHHRSAKKAIFQWRYSSRFTCTLTSQPGTLDRSQYKESPKMKAIDAFNRILQPQVLAKLKLQTPALSIFTILACTSLLFSTPSGVNGQTCKDYRKLPILAEKQRSDSWCWAAAANIEMRYRGEIHEQCYVVDAVRQNQLGIHSPSTCCIAHPETTPNCGDILSFSSLALDEFRFKYDMVAESRFDWPQLIEQICHDTPIVYGEDYKNGAGHQYIIYGFIEDQTTNEKNIIIYDPMDPVDTGPDYREEPYETWLRMQPGPDEIRSNVDFLINVKK